jgi:hypothetical protein
MHWLWRATIAVVASIVLSLFLIVAIKFVGLPIYLEKLGRTGSFIAFVSFFGIPSIMSLAVFGALTKLLERGQRARENRRRNEGLCIRCTYNLEGNVSGFCPECGEQI